MSSTSSSFKRHLRDAVAQLDAPGWTLRGAGLNRQGHEGHWGQIVFAGTNRADDPLALGVTAGVCSPVILREVNGRDPVKPPSSDFVGSTVMLVYNAGFRYGSAPSGPVTAVDPTDPMWKRSPPVVLGPDSATEWLRQTLGRLHAQIEPLLSDRALRDRLVANPSATFLDLRDAAILTQAIGDDDALGPLLDRAEQVQAAHEERSFDLSGARPHPNRDQQVDYPQNWSHARFVRFLDELRERSAAHKEA